MNNVLSIIIPVRNNSQGALRILSDIHNQMKECDLKRGNILIEIIDDASDDDTERVVKPIAEEWGFIYTRLAERRGAGGARNLGVERALKEHEAKYVCFFDSDDMLVKGALKEIYAAVTKPDKDAPDAVMWGFVVIKKGGGKIIWMPKFKNEDEWTETPVAPWIHAIRSYLVQPFPTDTLLDDAQWWIRQAEVFAEKKSVIDFIPKPLYIYDKTSGGCTRANEFFNENPMHLDYIVMHDVMRKNGFPDRYVSDCLRNLAAMFDLRNELHDERIRKVWHKRFVAEINACFTGRWGW